MNPFRVCQKDISVNSFPTRCGSLCSHAPALTHFLQLAPLAPLDPTASPRAGRVLHACTCAPSRATLDFPIFWRERDERKETLGPERPSAKESQLTGLMRVLSTPRAGVGTGGGAVRRRVLPTAR
ncbi:hypothetical protein AAFF_G00400770 [Aldrovandia affinis]|uniref:Uncharacterized protein n=1 Tax=Aldrovandia affinis TaxID=143900 RepID=A0AAD7SD01_9TELE|nr:hypothetical protein AAFF_G00400770 [Aldrovandia affinis]